MADLLWQKPGVAVDAQIQAFLAGDDVLLDREFFLHDIAASAAHAEGLQRIGILTKAELADLKRELAEELGILDPNEGVCQRATFIVDPDGIIRFVAVTDLSVGRDVDDVLRVLDALQTDELCPCNWQPGEETLKVA